MVFKSLIYEFLMIEDGENNNDTLSAKKNHDVAQKIVNYNYLDSDIQVLRESVYGAFLEFAISQK